MSHIRPVSKQDLKRSVQCHVFAQSPIARRPSDKHPFKNSHRTRSVYICFTALSFGSNGNSKVSTQSDTCVCVCKHTYNSQYRDAGRAKELQILGQQ